MKKIQFESEGKQLVGNLYLPENFDEDKKYSAVITVGSWTTVKEQMSGAYAKMFADKGVVALAFDFRNYCESEGDIPFYESPEMKIEDIKNSVSYLESLEFIDEEKIGGFAVCAGAGYLLRAASEDSRIHAVVTSASWLHDSEAVKLFYGGAEGVAEKMRLAKAAKAKYKEKGEIEYVPAISETDTSAAMVGPYDYYLNPQRGAVPQWSSGKFAVASWEDWLTFNPMPSAEKLEVPVLMIHSDGCVLPDYTKKYFENISSEHKKLYWAAGEDIAPLSHQFEFYDQKEKMDLAVNLASDWFGKYLY